jgi:carbamoyl-phosphate synthase large subunit
LKSENYIEKLNELIKKEAIEYVHPQPDIEVEIISDHREKVEAKTYLPSKEAISLCHEKLLLNKHLEKAGIPVPKSISVERTAYIPEIIDELKSTGEIIWCRAVRGAGSKAALPVKTDSQAEEWIRYWRTMRRLESKDFMLAEFLPGKEFAFQTIWKDGELITSQARERLEYVFGNLTPSGQSSSPSVAKTVHRDDVNETGTNAVLAVDKHASGVFCIDMKENKEGVPCVTEINIGRFFTTSNFFAQAGINMPHILLKLAYDEELPSVPKYNPVPENLYWIRLMDKGPILVKEGDWRCTKI